jgi:hypothetical protein
VFYRLLGANGRILAIICQNEGDYAENEGIMGVAANWEKMTNQEELTQNSGIH